MLPENFRVHTLGGANDLKGTGNWLVLIDRQHPNPEIRRRVAQVLEAAGYSAKDQKRLPRDFVLLPGRADDLDEAERANVILELLGEHLREVFMARGVYFKGQAGIQQNRIQAQRAQAEARKNQPVAPAPAAGTGTAASVRSTGLGSGQATIAAPGCSTISAGSGPILLMASVLTSVPAAGAGAAG